MLRSMVFCGKVTLTFCWRLLDQSVVINKSWSINDVTIQCWIVLMLRSMVFCGKVTLTFCWRLLDQSVVINKSWSINDVTIQCWIVLMLRSMVFCGKVTLTFCWRLKDQSAVVTSIELYLFVPVSMTFASLQGHRAVAKTKPQYVCFCT